VTPSEIKSYFRDLVDEPDETFLSDAQVQRYLNVGYAQFRREISSIDPLVFAKKVEFSVTSSRSVDLTSITDTSGASASVFGNSVTAGNRLMQLISLEAVNTDGEVVYEYQPVSNMSARNYMRFSYSLQGEEIKFGAQVTETIRMTYLPEASVTWTEATNQLDNMTMFHDVVALFAYSQYAMRDGAESQPVLRQLNQRVGELREFVYSRHLEGSSYVARVGWDDFGWL
jgi:ABC-type hemin transport system ATPase subunit